MPINTIKQDEASTSVPKYVTLWRLIRYLFSYKMQIAAVLSMIAVCVCITLINPLLMEYAIDGCIQQGKKTELLQVGLIALVINLLMVICLKGRMYLMAKVSNQILLTIRQELYTHIQTLGFGFFNSRPTGKILARIIGDVNSLKAVLTDSVTTLIPDFITICAVAGIMFVKNWQMALASLSSLPFMILGVWFVQTKAHVRWQIYRKKGSNLNAFIHEDISGMRVIQGFCAQDQTRNTFDQLQKEHKDAFISAVRFGDAFGPIVDLCWGVGTACLYLVGVQKIRGGSAGVGTLIAFGTYISMFWRPVMNLSNFYNQIVTNIAGAERIFEIIDTPPELKDEADAEEMPQIEGEVEFDHVSFSYEPGVKVLDDVSFRVKPGETIALVGPTGAGKTTIIQLIARFYEAQSGKILIDGKEIKKVTIESLRSQMGIMTQDNFLFSGTIRENIRYGKLDASEEEIIHAAKAVNAHEFIMKLEKGYDTELKTRGAGLSVGQRQLLAFARTMVSMPKILILDEATSNIDTNTELLIQRGIEKMLEGRTSFIIAHRLSTIQKADRIFVIDDGKITEEGSPKELMKRKGAYYQLYMAQFSQVSENKRKDS